jgi:hypothetical protein
MSEDPLSPIGPGDASAPGEAEALADVERRLREERPVPAGAFRAMLRQSLLGDVVVRPTRPRRLRLLIAAYSAAGVVLLTVAGVGVLGGGPLAT